jgi:hypothetical protein
MLRDQWGRPANAWDCQRYRWSAEQHIRSAEQLSEAQVSYKVCDVHGTPLTGFVPLDWSGSAWVFTTAEFMDDRHPDYPEFARNSWAQVNQHRKSRHGTVSHLP